MADTSLVKQEHGEPRLRNLGDTERRLSLIGGAVAGLVGIRRGGVVGLLLAGLGAMFMYRGSTGHCGLYQRLGLSTARPDDQGLLGQRARSAPHMQGSVVINRDRSEVYRYWRDFTNLARFMRYIEEVRPVDEDTSHWIADIPMAGRLEWNSKVTVDEPDERIAWRSVEGSEIETVGEVRFRSTPSGTEVDVEMMYQPPGTASNIAAKLARTVTQGMLREDLKRFKRILESDQENHVEASQ